MYGLIVISGRLLKELYPNILHITCIAHALHNLCEEIREFFDDVNEFIGKTKQLFVKCPSRTKLFKDIAPDIPLPPAPIITRWGTWLDAVHYYQENFDKVQEVIHFIYLLFSEYISYGSQTALIFEKLFTFLLILEI